MSYTYIKDAKEKKNDDSLLSNKQILINKSSTNERMNKVRQRKYDYHGKIKRNA